MNRRRFFRWAHQRLAPHGVPFLRRWMLALGPLRIYLHHFQGDDPREALHSHPFSGVSLILRGAYVEELIRPTQWTEAHSIREYRAPALNRIHRGDYHHTTMAPGCRSCWTLLLAWQPHRWRRWGFLTPRGEHIDSRAAWARGLRIVPEPGGPA